MKSWVHPGKRVLCINDTPDNGKPLPIIKGQAYTIMGVHPQPYTAEATISLNIPDKPNEFWLNRFEPYEPA